MEIKVTINVGESLLAVLDAIAAALKGTQPPCKEEAIKKQIGYAATTPETHDKKTPPDVELTSAPVQRQPAKTSVSIKDIRAKANECISSNEANREKVKLLLRDYGVTNLSSLEKDYYNAFYEALEVI